MNKWKKARQNRIEENYILANAELGIEINKKHD